ncbi:MAG: isochorismatase family protein [Gammaproteobacteria bacterium]
MAVDLKNLVDPARTAVVVFEMQVGIVGPGGPFPALTEAVQADGIVPRIAELLRAARRAGARVCFGTAAHRADRQGSSRNTLLMAVSARTFSKRPLDEVTGRILPELGPEPSDLIMPRLHGVSGFHDTGLDSALRNMGISTVIAAGVSINVGIPALVIDASNRNYQVVLPRDCVTGTPREFKDPMIDHSLGLLATVTTSADIIAAWGG